MFPQKLNPLRAFVQGAGRHHWVTDDGGATFTRVAAPGDTLGWYADFKGAFHPTKGDWILTKARRTACVVAGGASSPACAHDLFVSQDFGRTWANLTANSKGAIAAFVDFDWGAALTTASGAALTPATRIFATAYTDPAAVKGPYPGWDANIHFVSSDSLFKPSGSRFGRASHRVAAACGNQVEVVGASLYVAMPATCPTHPDGSPRVPPPGVSRSNVALYVSGDGGSSFQQVCLPSRELDLGYSLTKTHDSRSALLAVNHDEADPAAAAAPAGPVYAPGGGDGGSVYSLSLPRARAKHGATDLSRVEGWPGAFLANQLDEGAMPPPGAGHKGRVAYDSRVRTRATFNGGGRWADLTPPTTFAHAACDRCPPGATGGECALHLHGPSRWEWKREWVGEGGLAARARALTPRHPSSFFL